MCVYLCIYEIHIRLHKIVVGHEQATGSIGYAILCIFACCRRGSNFCLKRAFWACNVSKASSCSSLKLRFKLSTSTSRQANCQHDHLTIDSVSTLKMLPAMPGLRGKVPSFKPEACFQYSNFGPTAAN